jgi:light-regulated signal transduction histidine kinase (bacteriophytochrome)
MSISLVHKGRLWGLISCANHSSPRYVPYSVRMACELIGRLTSQQIEATGEREEQERLQRLRGHRARLAEAMRAEAPGILAGLVKHPEELLALTGASGAAVFSEGHCWTVGRVPQEALEGLIGWLRESVKEEVFHTRALPRLYPPAEAFKEVASGLLAISLPKPVPDHVLWFRPEVIQTVNWGGNPTKPMEVEATGMRLHPRRSFELWKQEVHLTSLPWSHAELEVAAALRRDAVELDLGRQVVREQQAVQTRDDVVAVVSHDLKSPLGAIQIQAGLILRALPQDQQGPWMRIQKSVEGIQRSTKRMSTLIQDLLDVAKIDARRFAIEPMPHSLGSLVEDCLELFRPMAEQQGVTLEQRLPQPEVLVSADRERICQVLSNLVENALKFTPAGGTIQITAEPAAGTVKLAVRDTGPGIPQEQLPHLFNRYWQAPQNARGGTGLGLYIAKGIVESHGGQIWVESHLGAGSTFTFTLPVVSLPRG